MQAAPALDPLSANELASAIDVSEDFDQPHKLKWHETGSKLVVEYGADDVPGRWTIHFGSLSKEERALLEVAIDREIVKQKERFPVRKVVRDVCNQHLADFLPTANQDKTITADALARSLESNSTTREEAKKCDSLC